MGVPNPAVPGSVLLRLFYILLFFFLLFFSLLFSSLLFSSLLFSSLLGQILDSIFFQMDSTFFPNGFQNIHIRMTKFRFTELFGGTETIGLAADAMLRIAG